jgi:CMP-N-acetylneuraminic acid synthetase
MTINIALICVRAGSKGLPGKNLLELEGKSLLARAVEQARSISLINRVIVSTDCPIMADIAIKSGADVPFMRPSILAADSSPEWQVWKHAINYLKSESTLLPNSLVVLPVTSPLRNIKDIEECISVFNKKNHDIVISVSEAKRNPYFNMVCINSKGNLELAIKSNIKYTRRQDAPIIYDITTVAYVVDPIFILNHSGIFDGKVGYVKVPSERAVDIDDAIDFELAKLLLRNKQSGFK